MLEQRQQRALTGSLAGESSPELDVFDLPVQGRPEHQRALLVGQPQALPVRVDQPVDLRPADERFEPRGIRGAPRGFGNQVAGVAELREVDVPLEPLDDARRQPIVGELVPEVSGLADHRGPASAS